MHRHSFYHQPKKARNICSVTLFRNEIIYDVDFASNRFARISVSEEEMKKAGLLTTETVSKDAKTDYMDRLIRHAITKVRSKLAFAIADDFSRMANDSIPTEEPDYTISFKFEEGWQGSPQNLCDYIHSFIVNSVLKEWFDVVSPTQAPVFEKKAADDLDEIIHIGRSVILSRVDGFYL